jgi:hypothetical protein
MLKSKAWRKVESVEVVGVVGVVEVVEVVEVVMAIKMCRSVCALKQQKL